MKIMAIHTCLKSPYNIFYQKTDYYCIVTTLYYSKNANVYPEQNYINLEFTAIINSIATYQIDFHVTNLEHGMCIFL